MQHLTNTEDKSSSSQVAQSYILNSLKKYIKIFQPWFKKIVVFNEKSESCLSIPQFLDINLVSSLHAKKMKQLQNA